MTHAWGIRDLSVLADRLAVLAIKSNRLRSVASRRIVMLEETDIRAAFASQGFSLGSERLAPLISLHGQLWDLENTVRTAEAKGALDGVFAQTAERIWRLNGLRKRLRCEIGVGSLRGHSHGVVVRVSPLAQLDRLAIRLAQTDVDDKTRNERDALWQKECQTHGVPMPTGDLLVELLRTHRRMTETWSSIDCLSPGAGVAAKIRLGRALFLLNDNRVSVHEDLRRQFNPAYWDVKEYASYPPPHDWCALDLRWRDECRLRSSDAACRCG